MAQMIHVFTKPSSKNAKKESHKGGSPGAPKHLNNIPWFHPLNKVSGFQWSKFSVVEFFSQFLFYLNILWYYSTYLGGAPE